jgi:peptidyl-prolyl cis-trans isomerase SurA
LGLALALAVAAPAAAQRLDGIAAVVNDEVVLQSEVEEQLYLFLMRSQARPDSVQVDTLRREILDQLIDEKLIVGEAKRQGVTVSDAEVNKQVDQALRDAKERMGTPEAFAEQLRRENLTEQKLREKYQGEVRRQLLAQRLVQKQVSRKPVSQTEAETYFRSHPDKFPKMPSEVRVSLIQIPARPDSAIENKARARATSIRARIVGGEKFAKVAAEVSDDPGSARAGGDLGFFTRGNMDPTFERAAFSQKVGEVGPPVRSAFGWHIIQTLERDTVKTRAGRDSLEQDGKPAIEVHARHILVKVDVSEADIERSRKLAERVRGEAVKGTAFATLVRRYSKYEGNQGEGGDLGFVSVASFAPNLRAGLDTLEVGEISDVLVNRAGFNIFRLVERKPERPYQLQEIRDDLPEAVTQIQFREKYDLWVKGLRAKAHIEIRSS